MFVVTENPVYIPSGLASPDLGEINFADRMKRGRKRRIPEKWMDVQTMRRISASQAVTLSEVDTLIRFRAYNVPLRT
jgi:hypothetical protein